jgi:hypothetical protein
MTTRDSIRKAALERERSRQRTVRTAAFENYGHLRPQFLLITAVPLWKERDGEHSSKGLRGWPDIEQEWDWIYLPGVARMMAEKHDMSELTGASHT